jgi:cytochrome c553
MAKRGVSYSIHDHKFDFSQPAPACAECHESGSVEGDKCSYHTPEFHLKRVKYPREMSTEAACVYCHNKNGENRDEAWAREVTPGLVDRFIVE